MTDQLDVELRVRRALDGLGPSVELSDRIATRVGRRERQRRAARTAGPALTALLVLVAGVGLLTLTDDDGDGETVVAVDPSGPARWQALPSAPVPPRAGPAAVWTGAELLVWGGGSWHAGRTGLHADGAAYSPASGTWRVLADAPLGPRDAHNAVWTGAEMIVWGGMTPAGEEVTGYRDGAAYDPADDTWRPIADAPVTGTRGTRAVWTGEEMIVTGGLRADDAPPGLVAVAYSPANDEWRPLPELDFADTGQAWTAWTGRELLHWRFTGTHDPARGVYHLQPVLHTYDPERDEWTRRADPYPAFDLAWSDASLAWTGSRLIVASATFGTRRELWADAEAIAYDPATDRWERAVLTPNAGQSLVTPIAGAAVATGGAVVVLDELGSSGSVLDPRTGEWVPLPPPPDGLLGTVLVVAGPGEIYAWGERAQARLTLTTDD